MLRVLYLAITLLLYVLIPIRVQAQENRSGISVLYLFDYQTNFQSANESTSPLTDILTKKNSVNVFSYYYNNTHSPTMSTTNCAISLTPSFFNEIDPYFKAPANNILAKIIPRLYSTSTQCTSIAESKAWLVLLIKSDSSVIPAICKTPTAATGNYEPTDCKINKHTAIEDFRNQLDTECPIERIFAPFEMEKKPLTITNIDKKIRQLRIRTDQCEGFPVDDLLTEVTLGRHQLSIDPGLLLEAGGSISNPNNKLSKVGWHYQADFIADFKSPSVNLDLSSVRIQPSKHRIAGISLWTISVIALFVSGSGFLAPSIYESCIPAPETLATYNCIGSRGSQELRRGLGYGSLGLAVLSGALGTGFFLK